MSERYYMIESIYGHFNACEFQVAFDYKVRRAA